MARPRFPSLVIQIDPAHAGALRSLLRSGLYDGGAQGRVARHLLQNIDDAEQLHNLPVESCPDCGRPMERCHDVGGLPIFCCTDCKRLVRQEAQPQDIES